MFAVLVTVIGFALYGLKAVSVGVVKVEFRESAPDAGGRDDRVPAHAGRRREHR